MSLFFNFCLHFYSISNALFCIIVDWQCILVYKLVYFLPSLLQENTSIWSSPSTNNKNLFSYQLPQWPLFCHGPSLYSLMHRQPDQLSLSWPTKAPWVSVADALRRPFRGPVCLLLKYTQRLQGWVQGMWTPVFWVNSDLCSVTLLCFGISLTLYYLLKVSKTRTHKNDKISQKTINDKCEVICSKLA